MLTSIVLASMFLQIPSYVSAKDMVDQRGSYVTPAVKVTPAARRLATELNSIDSSGIPLGNRIVFVKHVPTKKGVRTTCCNNTLWIADLVKNTTLKIASIPSSPYDEVFGVVIGSTLILKHRRDVIRTDGTRSGTKVVGKLPVEHNFPFVAGQYAVFVADNVLYAVGPNSVSPEVIKTFDTGVSISQGTLESVGGPSLFVVEPSGSAPYELWRTDGTTNGTSLVASLERYIPKSPQLTFSNGPVIDVDNSSIWVQTSDGRLWTAPVGSSSVTAVVGGAASDAVWFPGRQFSFGRALGRLAIGFCRSDSWKASLCSINIDAKELTLLPTGKSFQEVGNPQQHEVKGVNGLSSSGILLSDRGQVWITDGSVIGTRQLISGLDLVKVSGKVFTGICRSRATGEEPCYWQPGFSKPKVIVDATPGRGDSYSFKYGGGYLSIVGKHVVGLIENSSKFPQMWELAALE